MWEKPSFQFVFTERETYRVAKASDVQCLLKLQLLSSLGPNPSETQTADVSLFNNYIKIINLILSYFSAKVPIGIYIYNFVDFF